jgi:hypothetical protein
LIWFSGFREEDLLLYYKSKWTQILTAATWQWVVYSGFFCEIF